MAIEEALTSLLSGVASGRRFWGRAPQGTSADDGAFLVINRITGPRDYHLKGASGYVPSRFQLDSYGATYLAAKTVARAIVSTLSGFQGTAAGTLIQAIFVDGEQDLNAEEAGGAAHLFRVSVDVIVHHDE